MEVLLQQNAQHVLISAVSQFFSNIYVVVIKEVEGKQPKSPGSYKSDELVTYADAKRSTVPRPYIAAVFSSGNLQRDVFVLGDGKNTTYSYGRKRRAATSAEYFNGPLEGDTSYSIFQRVFVGDKVLCKFIPVSFPQLSCTNQLNLLVNIWIMVFELNYSRMIIILLLALFK